jgi:hypothetical protein
MAAASLENGNLVNPRLGPPEQLFWQPGALTRKFEQGVWYVAVKNERGIDLR